MIAYHIHPFYNDTEELPGGSSAFMKIYLDKIYCVRSHLAERLPELISQNDFRDISGSAVETLGLAESQIQLMDEMYALTADQPAPMYNSGLAAELEEAYQHITDHSNVQELRDRALLYYLEFIESVEITAFKALRPIAIRPDSPYSAQLLKVINNQGEEHRPLAGLLRERSAA